MLKKICLILLAITVFVVILIPDKNAIPRGAQSIGAWYYKNGNDVYFEKGWGFFLQLHDPYETYRIDEADGKTAESALERLKQVLGDNNSSKEDIEEATKTLNDVMMKIGQAIYSHAGDPEKAPEADATEKKNEDGSVEAEVEEK